MERPLTFAIIGCGDRGLNAYAKYALTHPGEIKIVAGADIRPERLRMLREKYGVPEEQCYESDDALLSAGKLADCVLVSTQDRQHVNEAVRALELGYDVLCEKPVSPDLSECLRLLRKAEETGRVVMIGHVLRYTVFYSKLKELLDRGTIGRLETVDAVEGVGYYHFAHSFVRGNWRRKDETSPMILAKCCHDMDYIRWLADAPCRTVQSFGGLSYFRAENAPEGSADRCQNCAVRANCPYDCEKIYITGETGILRNGPVWPASVVADDPTEENLRKALSEGPYGRCVFRCDNDVADRQTVSMEFENGVLATFTTTAFTREIHRTIRLTGTRGEITGDFEKNEIRIGVFGEPEQVLDLSEEVLKASGHGGGDMGLIEGFLRAVREGKPGKTGIRGAIDSHVMALAAEESRVFGGRTLSLSAFRESADKTPGGAS